MKELETEKESLGVKDLMAMLGIGYNSACKIMRQVKAVSDRLHIRGHIHKLDWQDYLNGFNSRLP